LRALQAKLEVVRILQATVNEIKFKDKLHRVQLSEDAINSFMEKITKGERIPPQDLIERGTLLMEEFSIQKLAQPQLAAMSRFFGLPALGNSFLLREQLYHKCRKIIEDDKLILKEGIKNLTMAELEEAVLVRGFRFNPEIDEVTRRRKLEQYLQEWIDLSTNNVPAYLILLSRYLMHSITSVS